LNASSGNKEEPLLESPTAQVSWDWAPDGRSILFGAFDLKDKQDLWQLPLEGDRKPIPVIKTPFNETQGKLSRDGHWLAYVSDETGQNEVYVQRLPLPSERWKVSSDGGNQPRWRRDGKELFFVSSKMRMMSAPINTAGTYQGIVPNSLFAMPASPIRPVVGTYRYDVAADGQRFLVRATVGPPKPTPLTVVLNWTDLLKK
jgi:Tol biopolymer transport system component